MMTAGKSRGMIYLLRHGAVECQPGGKRYIGVTDIALSATGRSQARAWANHFAEMGLEAIYCSDLIRCRETAGIIAGRCSLTLEARPELREVYLGKWEGRRFNTIKSRYPRAFEERGRQIADYRPPGGESFRDLQHRVWPVFESIAEQVQSRTLIVTHAGVIRVLLCRLLGMPLDHLFSIGQADGAMSMIEVRPAGFRLQALNLQPHQHQADDTGLLKTTSP